MEFNPLFFQKGSELGGDQILGKPQGFKSAGYLFSDLMKVYLNETTDGLLENDQQTILGNDFLNVEENGQTELGVIDNVPLTVDNVNILLKEVQKFFASLENIDVDELIKQLQTLLNGDAGENQPSVEQLLKSIKNELESNGAIVLAYPVPDGVSLISIGKEKPDNAAGNGNASALNVSAIEINEKELPKLNGLFSKDAAALIASAQKSEGGTILLLGLQPAESTETNPVNIVNKDLPRQAQPVQNAAEMNLTAKPEKAVNTNLTEIPVFAEDRDATVNQPAGKETSQALDLKALQSKFGAELASVKVATKEKPATFSQTGSPINENADMLSAIRKAAAKGNNPVQPSSENKTAGTNALPTGKKSVPLNVVNAEGSQRQNSSGVTTEDSANALTGIPKGKTTTENNSSTREAINGGAREQAPKANSDAASSQSAPVAEKTEPATGLRGVLKGNPSAKENSFTQTTFNAYSGGETEATERPTSANTGSQNLAAQTSEKKNANSTIPQANQTTAEQSENKNQAATQTINQSKETLETVKQNPSETKANKELNAEPKTVSTGKENSGANAVKESSEKITAQKAETASQNLAEEKASLGKKVDGKNVETTAESVGKTAGEVKGKPSQGESAKVSSEQSGTRENLTEKPAVENQARPSEKKTEGQTVSNSASETDKKNAPQKNASVNVSQPSTENNGEANRNTASKPSPNNVRVSSNENGTKEIPTEKLDVENQTRPSEKKTEGQTVSNSASETDKKNAPQKNASANVSQPETKNISEANKNAASQHEPSGKSERPAAANSNAGDQKNEVANKTAANASQPRTDGQANGGGEAQVKKSAVYSNAADLNTEAKKSNEPVPAVESKSKHSDKPVSEDSGNVKSNSRKVEAASKDSGNVHQLRSETGAETKAKENSSRLSASHEAAQTKPVEQTGTRETAENKNHAASEPKPETEANKTVNDPKPVNPKEAHQTITREVSENKNKPAEINVKNETAPARDNSSNAANSEDKSVVKPQSEAGYRESNLDDGTEEKAHQQKRETREYDAKTVSSFNHKEFENIEAPKMREAITRTIKMSEIIKELSTLMRNKEKSQITLQLNPESLGKVKVVIEVIDDIVKAHIKVENQAVQHTLQSNMSELSAHLERAGLQFGGVNISLYDPHEKESKQSYVKRKQNNSNNAKDEAPEEGKGDTVRSLGYNTYEYLA